MKNILIATFILSLIGCTSQKKLETSGIPFEIGQSSFQPWSGGREESGSGAELKISIAEAMNDMSFEKIYFRGRALQCEIKTENGLSTLVAAYTKKGTTEMPDEKEGIKMQEMFQLQPDEAIVAFKTLDSKLKYTKVSDIKEKAPILYRSRPKN